MALLAYLATERKYRHSRASLLGLLWPEMGEEAARNNLRVVLSRLRNALEREGPPILESDRHWIWFNQAVDHQLDVAVFRRILEMTAEHEHERRSECQACQAKLATAADLYRGDFLAGFYLEGCPAFDEWLFVQREGFRVQMTALLAELAHFHTNLANYPIAIAYARRQLDLDPLQEGAHRQLMRLLTYQGKRSAALAQFQSCQRILNEELGVDPESKTVHLYQQIKDNAPDLSLQSFHTFDPAPPLHKIPMTTTPFIGREDELAQLEERLSARRYRLLAIIGPGGIGKTRLAIEAARNQQHLFADGALFVSLAELATAAEIPAAILAALDLSPVGGPQSLQEFLLAYLEDKNLLLILDNMEHVMEGVMLLISILQRAPDVMLIITSREEPQVQAADLFFLSGLPVPESSLVDGVTRYASVRLFVDRARRIIKPFSLDKDNLSDVVEICRLVEGLPLGIELAANAARDCSCATIAASLTGDLSILETNARDVSPQHRSMQAVFENSWRLLSQAEQKALAQLAVFRGGFDYAAMKAITATSRLLATRLRHKSLIRRQGNGRLRMHFLIRQMALTKLASSEIHLEPLAVRQEHSHYYLKLLADHDSALNGWHPARAQRFLLRELDNLRQAWQFAVENGSWKLLTTATNSLSRLYALSGLYQEGEIVFKTALSEVSRQRAGEGPRSSEVMALRTRLLMGLVVSLLEQAKIAESQPLVEQIVRLAEQCDDTYSQAYAQLQLGANLMNQGNNAAAWSHLEQGLTIARANGLPQLEGILLRATANWWRQRGDYEQFESSLLQALAVQRAAKNAAEVQTILTWLGLYRRNQGDIWGGRRWLEEARTMNEQVGDRYREATVLAGLGIAQMDVGQFSRALQSLMKAHQVYSVINDRWHIAWVLTYVALCYHYLGDWAKAMDTAVASINLAQADKMDEVIARSTIVLAFALAAADRIAEATEHFRDANHRWRRIGNQGSYLEAIAGLAEMSMADKRTSQAANYIAPILAYLQKNDLSDVVDPFRVHWTCYQVLQANEDERAFAFLKNSHEELMDKASLIKDKEACTAFLTNFPAHRQLIAAWNET